MLQRQAIVYLSFILMIFSGPALAASDSFSGNKKSGFRLAPEFHMNEDLHTFFLQKDFEFRQRYFLEWISGAELAFFSMNDRLFFFGEMAMTMGLGKWETKAILFDPREVDAGFGPLVEYRFPPVNVSLGLDHHCFHEIDTLYLTPVYWNKLYLSAASKNFRPGDYKTSLMALSPLTWGNRISWQASLGYYFHELFGMDTSIISWNNDHAVDIIGEVHFAAYRWRGFFGVVGAKTGAYLTRTNGTLWRQEAGAEIMATQGKFGLSLFVNWIMLDQLQKRLNRDKLLVVGIRGFM
jgi:hypothetical protein